MRRIVATLLLLCSITIAGAQQARQYSFSHFTTGDGLASNFIHSIVQDRDRYIWIATNNGLQRYDGKKFVTVKMSSNRPGSLPSKDVRVLYRDRKDRIWTSCVDNAVGLFNTRRQSFQNIPVQSRPPQNFTTGKYFFEDLEGNLLLHDYGALYKYNEEANRFEQRNDHIPWPKGWQLSKFVVDAKEKKYWMCADSGLAVYNPRTRHLNYRGHNIDGDALVEKSAEQNILSILATDEALLYAAWPVRSGLPYVYKIDKDKGIKKRFSLSEKLNIGYHEIGGFLQQKSGRTWIYGNPLLVEWTAGEKEFLQVPNEYRNEQSIKFDHLFSTYEDTERNVWLATDNGVFLFNPDAQVFNAYNMIRPGGTSFEAPVQAMAEMNDGSLFVGCWGKGLYYFDKNLEPLPLPKSLQKNKDVMSIWDMHLSKRSGKLWMGLQPGGVIVYDPVAGSSVYYDPPLFNQRTIRQLEEDTDGNFWLGAQDGKLYKWDVKKSGGDPTKGYELVLQTGRIHKLHIDPQGYLWVATDARGLLKIDTRTHQVRQQLTSDGKAGYKLFNNQPVDITQYNDSTMIVIAGNVNIVHTNTGKVDFFGVEQGLPSNTGMSVQKDDRGILWVGMLNGLCRVNLARRITTFYDRRDGIAYDNFSSAGIEKFRDGRIVLYTDHNFVVFDPAHFFQTTKPAKPVITALTLEGRSLLLDSLRKEGAIELRYDNTSLTFEFSTLSFIKEKKHHYYYKLDGVDKDWAHLDGDNRAIYSFLQPGRYVFSVKSENADGLLSEETVSLPVVVTPPMWRTWWFYGLVILIIASGLYVIDRERLKRLKSLQEVRTQIAGNLHQEVETTLSNINVLSEIAKIRAGTNVEQSKDFIDQISRKSRTMMEAMDDVLWSINPDNDSMGKTILRIKEFTDGIRSTHAVDIDLIVDKKVQLLHINMVLRHELFFFYKEAVQFLLQHNSCDQVFVHLTHKASMLKLELLSECGNDVKIFKENFRKAISGRVATINGNVDITTDRKSLAIVLSVPL